MGDQHVLTMAGCMHNGVTWLFSDLSRPGGGGGVASNASDQRERAERPVAAAAAKSWGGSLRPKSYIFLMY